MNDQEYYYARLIGTVKNPKEFYDKFNKTEMKLNNFRRDNEVLKKKLSQCQEDLKKTQEDLKEARKALRSIAQNDLVVPLGRGKREIQSGDLEFHQEEPDPLQGKSGLFQNPSAPPPPYSEIAFSD